VRTSNLTVKGLSKRILLSKSHEARVAASSLLKQIEKFEFIFLVVLQTELLETINAIYNAPQSQNMMLDTTVKLLKNSTDSLVKIRDNRVKVNETAEETSIKWGVKPKFQHKCIKKTKTFW
jgi:hypothetical protein